MAVVGLLTLEIHIEHSHSLKDKRQVLRPLKDRLRNRHNVSVAELEHQDTWQDSVVGIAAVAASEAQAESMLQATEAAALDLLGPSLTGSTIQIF